MPLLLLEVTAVVVFVVKVKSLVMVMMLVVLEEVIVSRSSSRLEAFCQGFRALAVTAELRCC